MKPCSLVREQYPEMLLCVATNGLNLEPHVAELARLQVSHVTLTVNAVDPSIGAEIYAWVRDGRTIYRGEAAAAHLLARQKSAITALKAAGITVKINTIVVPGINQDHICEVAEEMRELGADIMNCIPLYPVEDTPFADKEEMQGSEIKLLREQVRGLPATDGTLYALSRRCRWSAGRTVEQQPHRLDARLRKRIA